MSNPFSTRHIRPGAIPFWFREPAERAALVDAVGKPRFRGAIVGPHGSGKSTLLATLRHDLQQAGRTVVLIELHDGQRRIPPPALAQVRANDVLIIDGYEQLGWCASAHLRWLAHRRNVSLLVTAHDDVRLPIVYRTTTDLPLARHLVKQLTSQVNTPLTDDDVVRAYHQRQGDLREMLFDLYDLHEQRTHRG